MPQPDQVDIKVSEDLIRSIIETKVQAADLQQAALI